MFDGINYLKGVAESNVLLEKEKFVIAECAGIEGIAPVMQEFQRASNFFLVDTVVDGSTYTNGSGHFTRQIYTCSFIMRHKWNDLNDRQKKKDMCRELYRQFLSRFIEDETDLEFNPSPVFLQTDIIRYKGMSMYVLENATGVTFTLPIDEPTDLTYNNNEWK